MPQVMMITTITILPVIVLCFGASFITMIATLLLEGFACYLLRWYPGPYSNHAGKRAQTFLCSLLTHVCSHINLSKLDLHLKVILLGGPVLEYSRHVCLCFLINSMRFSSWLMLCYGANLLQSIRLCPFWGKTAFCASGHAQFQNLYYGIESDMLHVLWLFHWFLSFCFSLPTVCQFQRLSQFWQSPVPLQFPLPDMVITIDAMPHNWTFILRALGFLSHVMATGLVLWTGCILPCKISRLWHSSCIIGP